MVKRIEDFNVIQIIWARCLSYWWIIFIMFDILLFFNTVKNVKLYNTWWCTLNDAQVWQLQAISGRCRKLFNLVWLCDALWKVLSWKGRDVNTTFLQTQILDSLGSNKFALSFYNKKVFCAGLPKLSTVGRYDVLEKWSNFHSKGWLGFTN